MSRHDARGLAGARADGGAKLPEPCPAQAVHAHAGGRDGGLERRREEPVRQRRGDSAVKLYEASTGREIRTLRGHEKQVYQVVFSPDGELLASASEDGTARLRRGGTLYVLGIGIDRYADKSRNLRFAAADIAAP